MSINHPLDKTKYEKYDLYLGNDRVKRAGAKTKWTKELVKEYKKCMNSVDYFCRNYVKIINIDEGLVNFNPYSYQEVMWSNFKDYRFNVVLSCRQSGKTIGVVGFLLHYALFNRNKEIAVVAHKLSQAKEILQRFRLALENLPFFLQPGCKAFNKADVQFDNNTNIMAYASSSGSLRGKSISLLYLDEFAFVPNDVEFMESTYPVISSGKTSKVIITSTANGVGNEFYNIYHKAKAKENAYKPFEVNWHDVPGRDEKWKNETISNIGQKRFDQEFSNVFFSESDSLISVNKLFDLKAKEPIKTLEDFSMKIFEEVKEGHSYIATIDVSQGLGFDYTTMGIFDITETPYKQVAQYRNNFISPLIFPTIAYKYLNYYNEAFCIIELNDHGIVVANDLMYNLEYDNLYRDYRSRQSDSNGGIKVRSNHKNIGCSNLKDLIEMDKLIINDEDTIQELFSFKRDKNSWNATQGHHDDTVSNLWLLAWFLNTDLFNYMYEKNGKLKDLIYGDKLEKIDSEEFSFPIMPESTYGGLMSKDDYEFMMSD